ncbi:hypothetical protein GE09DRAFT_28156 [Coniochaeta sp. 2T2.1]|nr:hypothetical protein GE09DRAFT_28156 [Coniochaeta sp. 2T2.1]
MATTFELRCREDTIWSEMVTDRTALEAMLEKVMCKLPKFDRNPTTPDASHVSNPLSHADYLEKLAGGHNDLEELESQRKELKYRISKLKQDIKQREKHIAAQQQESTLKTCIANNVNGRAPSEESSTGSSSGQRSSMEDPSRGVMVGGKTPNGKLKKGAKVDGAANKERPPHRLSSVDELSDCGKTNGINPGSNASTGQQ